MNYSIIIFFVLIFLLNCFIFNNGVLVGDDIFFYFFIDGIKFFKNFLYGTWLMETQNLLMYYIPSILNIDLNEWALTFGTIFKSMVITLLVYVYSKFLLKNKIENKIIIPSTFILYMTFFILLKKLNFTDVIIYVAFFRFIIVALLIILFLYEFYNFFVHKRKNSLLLCILAFITAYSSEIAFSILLTTVFLSLLYLFCCKEKDKKEIIDTTLIFLSLCIGTIILISSSGFESHIQIKITTENYSLIKTINASLNGFFHSFFKYVIKDYVLFYIAIIPLIIGNIVKKNKRTVFLSTSIILGCLSFSLSLISLGKTHYQGGYWIEHLDIYSVLAPVGITSFIILFTEFISKSDIKIKNAISILLISTIFFLIPITYRSIKTFKTTNSSIKLHSYMRDKIRLFYAYKNEKPIIPNFASLASWSCLVNQQKVQFGESSFIPSDNPKEKLYYSFLEENYFTNAYKLKTINKQNSNNNLVSDSEALKKFLESGGNCDEIYSGEFKFSNLRNEKFVLNKQ